MAHGQRTAGAVQGAAAGAAAGPFGAAIGGAVGYGLASISAIGGKKKKKPAVVAKPNHTALYVTIGVTAVVLIGGVVLILALRKK